MPLLEIADPGYRWLSGSLAANATDAETIRLENSGHVVQEEAPVDTVKLMLEFLI